MKRNHGFIHSLLPISLFPCLLVSLFPCLSLALSFCLTGCSRPIIEAEKRAAVDEFYAHARSCWPSNERNGSDAGSLRLAIESVASAEDMTHIRLVAYALNEAVDFHLPVYRMSAGRWLINESGRAYLLTEQCREFKLKDRRPSSGSSSGGQQIPQDGRIRLNPGQAFEATLVFPPLPDRTRGGALVYEGRVLPFMLLTETRRR